MTRSQAQSRKPANVTDGSGAKQNLLPRSLSQDHEVAVGLSKRRRSIFWPLRVFNNARFPVRIVFLLVA